MTYEDFTDHLRELHVPEKEWPSVDEYHDTIERVYNYHPALSVPFGQSKTAEMYARYGIGIFYVMWEEADEVREMEKNMRRLREKRDAAQREYDEACERFTAYRQSTMKMWRCE